MDNRASPIPEDNHNLGIRPCIAELLRTGYPPSVVILRVERVVEIALPSRRAPRTYGWTHPTHRSYRLYLSDGELVIQALLNKTIHRFVSTGEIKAGTVVLIERFDVGKAARLERRSGHVLFLALDRLRILRNHGDADNKEGTYAGPVFIESRRNVNVEETPNTPWALARRSQPLGMREDTAIQGIGHNEAGDTETTSAISQSYPYTTGSAIEEPPKAPNAHLQQPCQRDSAADFTEPSTVPGLAESETLDVPVTESSSEIKEDEAMSSSSAIIPTLTTGASLHSPSTDDSRSLKPIERPLNLLTLSELVYPSRPFPKRNYVCDIFAVISWISPDTVKRPYMPLKRDLRVVDPTIAQKPSGVSVSVFVDAASFSPPAGTVALFRSLKTHEWEGISLNAYESECKDRQWFITDPEKLKGYDVNGLKKWWKARLEDMRQKEEEKERGLVE